VILCLECSLANRGPVNIGLGRCLLCITWARRSEPRTDGLIVAQAQDRNVSDDVARRIVAEALGEC